MRAGEELIRFDLEVVARGGEESRDARDRSTPTDGLRIVRRHATRAASSRRGVARSRVRPPRRACRRVASGAGRKRDAISRFRCGMGLHARPAALIAKRARASFEPASSSRHTERPRMRAASRRSCRSACDTATSSRSPRTVRDAAAAIDDVIAGDRRGAAARATQRRSRAGHAARDEHPRCAAPRVDVTASWPASSRCQDSRSDGRRVWSARRSPSRKPEEAPRTRVRSSTGRATSCARDCRACRRRRRRDAARDRRSASRVPRRPAAQRGRAANTSPSARAPASRGGRRRARPIASLKALGGRADARARGRPARYRIPRSARADAAKLAR